MKDKIINIRVTEKEKVSLMTEAKNRGFDTLSAFILWVVRNWLSK